eukprot:snap_masked-scaffold_5-processed-gene-0.13-mRNA-1 protein AED:1.00 eAED:1.00 QI:0/0/0/0/1/1/2/0/72
MLVCFLFRKSEVLILSAACDTGEFSIENSLLALLMVGLIYVARLHTQTALLVLDVTKFCSIPLTDVNLGMAD